MASFAQLVTESIGKPITNATPLSSSASAEVFLCDVADGQKIIVKIDRSSAPLLNVEAWTLYYLQKYTQLPVPSVIYAEPKLMIMEYVEGESVFSAASQEHAAELIAHLHNHQADYFGFKDEQGDRFDTVIGGIPQPNPPTESWIDFFRENRLLYMAGEAALDGQLPMELLLRLDRLAGRLELYLTDDSTPSLIHGDLWTRNILARDNLIVGIFDPSIYYADPEIELAFITLFGTFGDRFFDAYQAVRPIQEGFFEVRRDLYNLYPLLVHARLFGGSYVQSVGRILKRFGY